MAAELRLNPLLLVTREFSKQTLSVEETMEPQITPNRYNNLNHPRTLWGESPQLKVDGCEMMIGLLALFLQVPAEALTLGRRIGGKWRECEQLQIASHPGDSEITEWDIPTHDSWQWRKQCSWIYRDQVDRFTSHQMSAIIQSWLTVIIIHIGVLWEDRKTNLPYQAQRIINHRQYGPAYHADSQTMISVGCSISSIIY